MKNILRYIGNMSNIDISDYIGTDCETYVEPFAGSFGAGFNLMEKRIFKKTVLNDKDYYVYNFWYCIKSNSDLVIQYITELYNKINNMEYKQAMIELDKYKESENKFIQAAYEYLYMYNKNIFGYNDDKIKTLRINEDDFTEAGIRLLDTDIRNLDYIDIIDIYDCENALFMIDPPYNVSDVNRYYRGKCNEFNHIQLRDIVNNIKGKYILRYNDSEFIRNLYKNNKILFETTKNLIGTEYREIYYTNI